MYNKIQHIHFNSWKHHLNFIREQIAAAEKWNESRYELIKNNLGSIGNSLTDVYTGNFSSREIISKIHNYLEENKIITRKNFEEWIIAEENDYKLVTLKDSSFWVIRQCDKPGEYIHIHPGKYSPLTRRIKTLTLETAVFVIIHSNYYSTDYYNIENINYVRKKYLNESPIKKITNDKGLGGIISLLLKHES